VWGSGSSGPGPGGPGRPHTPGTDQWQPISSHTISNNMQKECQLWGNRRNMKDSTTPEWFSHCLDWLVVPSIIDVMAYGSNDCTASLTKWPDVVRVTSVTRNDGQRESHCQSCSRRVSTFGLSQVTDSLIRTYAAVVLCIYY